MKTMKRILLLVILLSASLAYGQNQFRSLNKADRAFYNFDFKKSLKHYLKALEVDTTPHVLRGIAQSYSYLQFPEEATPYFEKLAGMKNALPFDILEYAQNLKKVGSYDLSLVWFEKYREIYPLDLRARNHSVNSYHYKKLARNKKNPLYFPLEVNDEGSILGLTAYKDGVIFSKSENNGSFDFMDSPEIFLDMLEAKISEEHEFTDIRYMPFNLNSDLHDGPSSYCQSSGVLAFTRNAAFTKETKESGSQLEILFSYEEDGKWQDPEPFKYNSKEYSVGHPAFSPDGKKLYFISNQPGGFGGTDIYVSVKSGKEWTKPVNLGPEVNTESDEMFPFVTYGDVVYFASEGHAGLGGLDIFKTYPFEDFWANPENLGAPVNSRSDDFSIVFLQPGEAYFCSNRVGGEGEDDIYYVNLEETKNFFTVPTKLIENDNVSPISVVNLKTGQENFHKMGESAFLDLDVTDAGYQVSWFHLGEKKNILISGEKNEFGVLQIDFSGLEGLKPADFLAQIEIVGDQVKNKVRIDQKVWTYEPLPESGFFSEEMSSPPNYAMGKDNITILNSEGEELRAETYPVTPNMNRKVVLFVTENQQEINIYKETLKRFCSTLTKGTEGVSISLMKSTELNEVQMELIGEEVEMFILNEGIPQDRISLEWKEMNGNNTAYGFSDEHEILITVDAKFALLE